MRLLINALIKFIFGILIVGALLFLPAGTFNYNGGIRFLILLFVPILILGIVLFVKSPDLLKRRLDSKEDDKTQKSVVAVSGIIFLIGFITAGLDFRFSLTVVSKPIVMIASILFLISYGLYCEVMRENVYLSRTISVAENQKVVDKGLYGIVRHPMYLATIIMFLMMPLILGSWISFIVFLSYPIVIAIRIKNEEKLLSEQLSGYIEYKNKVKYRILPFVW